MTTTTGFTTSTTTLTQENLTTGTLQLSPAVLAAMGQPAPSTVWLSFERGGHRATLTESGQATEITWPATLTKGTEIRYGIANGCNPREIHIRPERQS